MAFLEKHKNPDTFPTGTGVNCMKTYFRNNGLRLANVIGSGSYSKVRLCVATKKDRSEQIIACKVISKRRASDDFVNKFLPRELEIVGRLRNPNIVTIFDIVEFPLHSFIFMDFCTKGDLLEFIKKKGFLSEKRSQMYFWQILSAIRYLHGLDLAHRDLKCENVLLCPNDVVKISDFGFSRYCHDINRKRILSKTFCGSAAYAAPEILQGTRYNPKLYDMWSLGCILFIMLTGHMPYDEANIQQMLQNQMDRILTYPNLVEGLISKSAKCLVRHLLEPDVTRRATIEHAVSNAWFASMQPTKDVAAGGSGDYDFGEPMSLSPTQGQPTSSRESTPLQAVVTGSRNEHFAQNSLKIPHRPSSNYRNDPGRNSIGSQQSSSKRQMPTSHVWRKVPNATTKPLVTEYLYSENHYKGHDKPFVSSQKSVQKPLGESQARLHDINANPDAGQSSNQKFQPPKHKFI